MKFKWMLDQRNMSVFVLTVRQAWKPFKLPNNVPTGTEVPKGNEHFHPAFCGTVLGPWTSWGTGKWSPVCWTWTGLGSFLKNIKCWMDSQHMAMWQGLISTQRQTWKLISGPTPSAKTRLLSFNMTQYRAVTGLLTEHPEMTSLLNGADQGSLM